MNRRIDRRAILVGAAGALAMPFIISGRAGAAERSITVGIYTAQQGEYVRKQIIPAFEADYKCKVYTTQGVTLEQIALMRATRNNPKYSVMFIDDIGVDLAKKEGLIEQLPADKIPNMERVLKRFIFNEGYGAAFAMSSVGLVYNSATGKPLDSYAELWDKRFRKRFLMTSPKATQSLYLLIAAVSVETGKPYAETQYMIEQAWNKMEALKPNVLSIFENSATVMQVAQGQADLAGLAFSKSVYPYTVKGAPIDMCFPKEGTFAGINCLTLVKGAPDPELGIAFINRMLDPTVQHGLAEATLTAPTISGLNFNPDIAKYMAYPEDKMDEMGIFSPDWTFINPIRSQLLEKYNQVFGA
jgi:putative spermidine/putrescine transport system substrate-binding protein